MGFSKLAITVAAIACVAGPSLAATVQPEQSDVLLNRGRGFHRVAGPTTAVPGDKVMASSTGGGWLVYDDSCRVRIDPGAVVTVQDESPCRTGAVNLTGALTAVAAGGVAIGLLVSDQKENGLSGGSSSSK